ncbi:MAG: hypothetical protein ACLGQX_04240 [Acidobacteriota bacterium]
MAKNTFTLTWILPYVRQGLKQTDNFEFRTYANALFTELEKANTLGVVRLPQGSPSYHGGQIFDYQTMPPQLRALVSEAFFHLFHKGYIAPEAPDSYLNQPHLHMFNVTQRGRAWLQGEEPLPEVAEQYMKFLRERVPALDSIIEQYVIEALTAFDRGAYFASAVMLGAALEKELYLLAEAVVLALKDDRRQTKLRGLLDRRRLLDLFEMVRDTIHRAVDEKLIPYEISEGSTTHLMSLYEAIRVQRNDAVHPMNAVVSEDSVRQLQAFPYALSKSEDLRDWLEKHPGSI